MWRGLMAAIVLYAGGDPGLAPYRPAAFDRSLSEFHRDVNRLVGGTMQAAPGAEHARALRQFISLSAQFQAMLTSR